MFMFFALFSYKTILTGKREEMIQIKFMMVLIFFK